MKDIKPFERKIWLASPTMHGEELTYMKEAYDTNWMSTVDEDIFARGLCLPSDNKTDPADIDRICEIIRSCFER